MSPYLVFAVMLMTLLRLDAFSQPSRSFQLKPISAHTGTQLSLSKSKDTATEGETINGNRESAADTNTNTYRPGSLMAATAEQGRVPYGEDSRKYRRTEFSYDDWVGHRNSEKIITNVKGMFFSGIIRQLKDEIILVALSAAFIVFWNDFLVAVPSLTLGGYDLNIPQLSLPALPFTLSSPALGLLLVFKTNASYGRWSEARTTWAKIISQARNIVRMSSTFVPQTEEGKQSMDELSKAIWLLCRSLMNDLSEPEDEASYREEVAGIFNYSDNNDDDMLVTDIFNSNDRTMAALTLASRALDSVPIDEKRRVEIDKSLVIIGDCIAVCEKIYSSPVPLVYTRHTGRFLSLWMILLPTALYGVFANNTPTTIVSLSSLLSNFNYQSLALIPTTAVLGIFLFGIDELAIQLEEPFSILPMQNFCNKVRQSTGTITDWSF